MATKKLTPTDKKMNKIVKRMDTRDKNPNDKSSNRAILREFGYSDNTKTSEVMESPKFQLAEARYFKNHLAYSAVQDNLAAKAMRNLDMGMDDPDKKFKLEYTKMQLKNEAEIASRSKLELKDENGNMMTLMGWDNTDQGSFSNTFTPANYEESE